LHQWHNKSKRELDHFSNHEAALPLKPVKISNFLVSSARRLQAPFTLSLVPRGAAFLLDRLSEADACHLVGNNRDEKGSIERLFNQYGQTTHMVALDPSYEYFLNLHHTGAIYYKIQNRVAVVAGDPLCSPYQIDNLLQEFSIFRKKRGLNLAFLGASYSFAKYAKKKNWTTMQFGWDRILKPTNNCLLNVEKVAQKSSIKRMLTQNRSLLNPEKGNLEIGIYMPSLGQDAALQDQMRNLYDRWRHERNKRKRNNAQAFITVYDPFRLPNMMVYIYTRDRETGILNGFAALRNIGAHK